MELPIDDDPDVVVLLLLLVVLLLLLLLFDDNEPLVDPWCKPLLPEFCCIGNNSHFDGVDCESSSSHFGWACDISDCDDVKVVRSSFDDTPMWFDKLESRQPVCGGGATSPIPREKPSSSGLKSEACERGLKKPEAVDGDGHKTPPPYTLRALWLIMLPVLAPQSAGGPTLSRKILNYLKNFRRHENCFFFLSFNYFNQKLFFPRKFSTD